MYISRSGKEYFLRIIKTKTGKDKYSFSTKNGDDCISLIPNGYEVYEPPNGNVFLRKKIDRIFSEEEKLEIKNILEQTKKGMKYILDEKKDGIGIFVDESYNKKSNSSMKVFYEPCFHIAKLPETNEYYIERYCFLGRIDDWIYLEKNRSLRKLCEKYFIHIKKESFFELI